MKVRSSLFAPVLFAVILILVGFAARFVTWMGEISVDPLLSAAIIQLLVFLLPLAFYCGVRGLNLTNVLKFRGFSLKKLPFAVVSTLLLFALTLLFRYMGLFWFHGAMVDTPNAIYLAIPTDSRVLKLLCDVLLPALLEEILFRGVLLEEYASYSRGFAVVVTSAMFAMIHLDPAHLFFYFCVGLILGTVTVVSDSLFPAVVMHVLYSLSYFYVRPGAVEYVRQAGKSPLLPYILIALVLVLVFLCFARLEDLFRDRSYDAMLQSRKELLMQEAEKNKPAEETDGR